MLATFSGNRAWVAQIIGLFDFLDLLRLHYTYEIWNRLTCQKWLATPLTDLIGRHITSHKFSLTAFQRYSHCVRWREVYTFFLFRIRVHPFFRAKLEKRMAKMKTWSEDLLWTSPSFFSIFRRLAKRSLFQIRAAVDLLYPNSREFLHDRQRKRKNDS